MTDRSVTDHLLHMLVFGSHAEGVTALAVAAAIENHDRVLLVANVDADFETSWRLPADRVLPGETLVQGLFRTVNLITGLNVIELTSYAGHHDRMVEDVVVRTFVFSVRVDDPERICRWANIGHLWSLDPLIAASTVFGLPPARTDPQGLRPSPLDQLCSALRAGAKGALCAEAAVEVLIGQESWLHRADFVDDFIDRWSTNNAEHSVDIACVDWIGALRALDAGLLPCSSGEGQLLRIAASIEAGIPVDLRDVIAGLDPENTGLVAREICHAAGHRP